VERGNQGRVCEKYERWSNKEEETERIWKEIKEKIEETILKVKKKRYKWKFRERVWHDKECKERKRGLRRKLRQ